MIFPLRFCIEERADKTSSRILVNSRQHCCGNRNVHIAEPSPTMYSMSFFISTKTYLGKEIKGVETCVGVLSALVYIRGVRGLI